MYVRREGLGAPWYQTALDLAAQAGSGIVGAQFGPAAAEALQSVHKAWTGAAFGPGSKPSTPPPQQASAPPPPPPSLSPARRAPPSYPPYPPAAMIVPQSSGPNWWLIGGLAGGALLLVLLLRSPKPKGSPR